MAPPPPRVKKALLAMSDIGFSIKVSKPVLKRLLTLYDNNYDYIEEDGYQVLIDSILEEQEKAADGKTENCVADDKCEQSRKRVINSHEMSVSPSERNSNFFSDFTLKKPKMESDLDVQKNYIAGYPSMAKNVEAGDEMPIPLLVIPPFQQNQNANEGTMTTVANKARKRAEEVARLKAKAPVPSRLEKLVIHRADAAVGQQAPVIEIDSQEAEIDIMGASLTLKSHGASPHGVETHKKVRYDASLESLIRSPTRQRGSDSEHQISSTGYSPDVPSVGPTLHMAFRAETPDNEGIRKTIGAVVRSLVEVSGSTGTGLQLGEVDVLELLHKNIVESSLEVHRNLAIRDAMLKVNAGYREVCRERDDARERSEQMAVQANEVPDLKKRVEEQGKQLEAQQAQIRQLNDEKAARANERETFLKRIADLEGRVEKKDKTLVEVQADVKRMQEVVRAMRARPTAEQVEEEINRTVDDMLYCAYLDCLELVAEPRFPFLEEGEAKYLDDFTRKLDEDVELGIRTDPRMKWRVTSSGQAAKGTEGVDFSNLGSEGDGDKKGEIPMEGGSDLLSEAKGSRRGKKVVKRVTRKHVPKGLENQSELDLLGVDKSDLTMSGQP